MRSACLRCGSGLADSNSAHPTTTKLQRKKMHQQGFELDRYESLLRQSERLRRYLAAQAAAEAAGHKLA